MDCYDVFLAIEVLIIYIDIVVDYCEVMAMLIQHSTDLNDCSSSPSHFRAQSQVASTGRRDKLASLAREWSTPMRS